MESLGRLVLGEVTAIGQVQILARDKVRSGHVEVAGLDVVSADARAQTHRPQRFGVHVLQGAVFGRITTHADGAVGIQISQPIGYLSVRRGIETFGGTGDSLVKGVVLKLCAIALSVKPGGSAAREIDIDGGVTTHGDGIAPLEMLGVVGRLSIGGGISAKQTH